ncbi:MAG TPA: hypothetical protein PLD47_07470 [Aggregatilineales bacterium]|nr:hypothetical protein [Anaerolineales bacterium]HRE47545.1 hypothetical protein [Aggregatilineales bacterium]
MDIKELEAALAQANADYRNCDVDTRAAAEVTVYELERKLAAAKGEAYATTLDFPVRWDVGAPMPHVFANEHWVFLTFLVADSPMIPTEPVSLTYAVVEFLRPVAHRSGSPSEDDQFGHYLCGRGQEIYRAQIVENSAWLREMIDMWKKANLEDDDSDEKHWQQRIKHYIFWFHDSTFECLARGYEVHTYHDTINAVVEKIIKRLLKG